MAWSPPAHNAGIVWVSAPGDYATFNSNHTPDGTRIDGHNQLPKLIQGVKFADGIEVIDDSALSQAQAAA